MAEKPLHRWAQKLRQWESRRDGRTYASVARTLGIESSRVRGWADGRVTPADEFQQALADILGEELAWFHETAETRLLSGAQPDPGDDGVIDDTTISRLAARLAALEDLLEPWLSGEACPIDPAAVRTLEQALGRQATGSRQDQVAR